VTERESILQNSWKNFSDRQQGDRKTDRYVLQQDSNRPVRFFLAKEFNSHPNGKILDVGSGLYSETYLPKERDIHLLDWIPHIVNMKNSHVCNAKSLPFEDKAFGIVLSKEVYGCLLNPEECLDEMIRVLEPDGLLVLIDWEANLKEGDIRVKIFDSKKVADQIKSKGFEIIKSVRLIDRTEIEENAYLTAIVARKKTENF
jgi:SAM-dependent methyltransferase